MKDLAQIKTSSPKSQINIKVDKEIDENVKMDFSYFLFTSIRLKVFTNFLKDEDEYSEKFKSFYHQTLPYIMDKSFQKLEIENGHCHPINDEGKVFMINKILEKYKKEYPNFKFPSYTDFGNEFYQLPGQNGIRLIGVRRGNTFTILFIDFHHLIYPNSNYNDLDYNNYGFEIHQASLREKDIILVSLTDEILNNPNCISCEHLEKMTF